MEVLYPKCAGLDVHKDSVVACVRLAAQQEVTRHLATFGTTTSALLDLSEWLSSHGVTHVAMESTGVYWKPVWHALSGDAIPATPSAPEDVGAFHLVLVNAMHIKKVPGRKTDVTDAEWIADLIAHGLVHASFVPPTPIQDLRALTRTRKQLTRERVQHVQRIQKTLEDANIKLASAISDVTGTTGRAILNAIADGEADPEKLADLVTTRIRAPRATIVESLRGNVRKPHRFLLRLHLTQVEALDAAIDSIDAEVGERLEPFRKATDLLITMPGIGPVAAQALVSEIGEDMARFPFGGAPRLLGRALSGQRRERRQAPLTTDTQGPQVAQDAARHRGLVGHQEEGRLPQGALPPHQAQARQHEGHRRCRRFDAARDLLHAP